MDYPVYSSEKRSFKSYRLRGEYPQPWLKEQQRNYTLRSNLIVYSFFLGSLCISAYLCYDGYRKVKRRDYCLILDDTFSQIDSSIWQREQQLDGYDVGSFDWTTPDDSNAYTSPNGLIIMPTLTNLTTNITPAQIIDGYRLNLTTQRVCTSERVASCAVLSNSTTGEIVNPVRSARLTTKFSKSIKYGRVEVIAKMPKGDWLLPSIRLLPVSETYGDWPKSGSVDIVLAKGNQAGYPGGGRNIFTSTLHWGVSRTADRFWKTTFGRRVRRTDYTKGYNTFGLEWTKDYLFTYHNGRTYSVLWIGFLKESLWELGQFPNNGSLQANPWAVSENMNAPFDQPFYLSLSVQVGATNHAVFPDSHEKPWIDASPHAAADFWSAVDSWYPTWGAGEDRGMTVRNVKMWQEGKCN
ncbi:Beta-glucanase [Drechslerella dactyloides]|uniref:Beta-glucanase n=1 Tax=Drechslerella dactyloides TaxID=74499 RepID=A0AAD6NL94_DREDA|nr:Beta-glucanase [Drechslerella dactyloides]